LPKKLKVANVSKINTDRWTIQCSFLWRSWL